MPIKGDFAKLGKLVQSLGKLATVPSQVAGKAAPRIEALVKAEFAAGKDPYGRDWAPLKPGTIAKGRTPPPLTDTHTTVDGTQARPMQGAGIAVTFPESYIFYSQRGTKHMKARPVLPVAGLPRTWSDAISQETRLAIKGAL